MEPLTPSGVAVPPPVSTQPVMPVAPPPQPVTAPPAPPIASTPAVASVGGWEFSSNPFMAAGKGLGMLLANNAVTAFVLSTYLLFCIFLIGFLSGFTSGLGIFGALATYFFAHSRCSAY